MKFKELNIKSAYLIELEPYEDERGGFTRQFCKQELAKLGIIFDIAQCNISTNKKRGTVRGMHYQKAPYPEQKINNQIKPIRINTEFLKPISPLNTSSDGLFFN